MTTDRVVGTRSGVEPTKLFATDPAVDTAEHPHSAQLRRWAREYLSEPHPDLGRPGAVCPYISHAIARRYLWAAFFDGPHITAQRIAAIIDDLYDLFPVLPPRDHEPDSQLKAVLAVFPDLTDYADIVTVQHDQKTRFVQKGLMLGQFYPGCTVAGLHNQAFPALDAPLPILAIRHMVPTDYAFLNSRHEWIETYLKIFAPSIPGFIAIAMSDKLVQTPDTRKTDDAGDQ